MKAIIGLIRKLKKFLIEAKLELFRVSWPSRSELWDSTLVVLFVSLFLSLFIGVFDKIFTIIISFVLG